jgi:hypothetical protein
MPRQLLQTNFSDRATNSLDQPHRFRQKSKPSAMPRQEIEIHTKRLNLSVSIGGELDKFALAGDQHRNRSTGLATPICPVVSSVLIALLSIFGLVGCGREPTAPKFSPAQVQALTAKAEKGDADAQRLLGLAYAKGEGVQQDYRQAAKWYEQSANQSNAVAQAALGELFEAGQGVARDEAQAANWYRRAAEQGFANAQYNLAALYAIGKGVPLNNAEALQWYLKAAEQGDALAQYNVGMRYFEGHGVKPDQVAAYKWLSLAADQKLPDAAGALAALKNRISSEDLAKARSLLRDFKVSAAANH